MKKVYLSHMGIACTLGQGKQEVLENLIKGQTPEPFDTYTLLSDKTVPVGRVPFDLPPLPEAFQTFDSRNNRLLKIVLDEIKDAIQRAVAEYGAHRVGIVLGTSTSGMFEEEQAFIEYKKTGQWPQGFHRHQVELSSPALFAAMYLGIQGPAYVISTACSSSGKALCSAARLLKAGICDAVITGGCDTLCGLTLNGFNSLELLSSNGCNPFSSNRDGITIGEGAAVFLATAGTYEGSSIELVGYGESSDAYHISSPEPEGVGASIAIHQALSLAKLSPQDIAYINLHGTGTALNDGMESKCVHQLFGPLTPCGSTKALTGHTLGVASALESAFLWLVLEAEDNGSIPLPPHVFDGIRDPQLPELNFVAPARSYDPKHGSFALMSNSFAFGGSNVSLIFKKRAISSLNVAELLPHEPPMVLIDRVFAFRDDFIHGQVTIQRDSPFCQDGFVPSYVSIEYMAQTVGIWNGLIAKRMGKRPEVGFLLGSRRMNLDVPAFKVGDVLDIFAKPIYVDGEMASFESWIERDHKPIVHAGLNVYQPRKQGD